MNNSTNPFAHSKDDMEVPFALKVLFYTVMSIFAILSIIGNSLEITTFLRTQNLRTSTNYYVTSMAFSDLIFVVSYWVLYLKSRLSVFEDVLTPFICKLCSYFGSLSFSVSVLSLWLVLMSVDRFVAIVFPMKVSMITGRTRTTFVLLTWFLPMAFILAFSFIRPPSEIERPWRCSSGEMISDMYNVTNIVEVVFLYFVPMIVMTILNSWIIRALRKTDPVIQENGRSKTIRHKRNQRIMKMLILIIAFFFLCWTPCYTFVFVWTFLDDLRNYIAYILYFIGIFILPFLSTLVNPVIIFSFSRNYRQALQNCVRVLFVKCLLHHTEQAGLGEIVELPEIQNK